jgi:PAS domain S-box-containing protein
MIEASNANSAQSILIVEDSNTQAIHLQAVLEDEGFNVVWAENAQQALQSLEEQSFDFVVTDIEMPGMDGYELCRKIKDTEAWRNLPVILLTSRKDPKNIILGLECGADSFFTKPYEADVLVRRIRQLLYNRSLRSQGRMKVGVEIALFGKVITINNEREQILDLLISTFEDIIQANSELEESQKKLTEANEKIATYVDLLENRVQTSEERHTAVFENLAEGAAICSKSGEIDSANPSFLRIFGCKKMGVAGKRIQDFLPLDCPDLQDWMEGESYRYINEIKCSLPVGAEVYVSCSFSRIGDSEESDYVCLVHDRTESRKIEERLRQSEKMEAIGQLTGGIAHDYNNQLTVIDGAADELRDYVSDSEGRSLVDMIATAAQAGTKLTRRLLTFARSQPFELQSIDVAAMLRELAALTKPLMGKEIEFNVSLSEKALWPVKLDRSELENALLNLCINAKHAMNDAGRIEIEASNLSVNADLAEEIGDIKVGDFVMLSISDNGCGIPKDIQSRIFEPFFTTKSAGKGTGMGLAMVYGFVKQSGGHIKLYSEEGVGTTFQIYLPRSMDVRAEDSVTKAEEIPVLDRSLRVFLVDDDALICKLAAKQFKGLGHQVETAHSGSSALEKLQLNGAYDLLIADMILGNGMNGTELAEKVSELQPDIKVLFTSGYTEQALLDQSLVKPNVNLLVKPYNRKSIQAAIEQVMKG